MVQRFVNETPTESSEVHSTLQVSKQRKQRKGSLAATHVQIILDDYQTYAMRFADARKVSANGEAAEVSVNVPQHTD